MYLAGLVVSSKAVFISQPLHKNHNHKEFLSKKILITQTITILWEVDKLLRYS